LHYIYAELRLASTFLQSRKAAVAREITRVNPTILRVHPISEGITTKICSLFMTVESPWLIEGSMRLVSDDYMDPLLEIWVDYSRSPVAIRLAGVLDGTTRSAFLSVMDDVIFEGTNTLVIDAGAVEIGDASGAQALALVIGGHGTRVGR